MLIIFTCYFLLYVLIMSHKRYRKRRGIRSLSDCNGIRTHSDLVRKRTLSHLAKLAKWLSCFVNTHRTNIQIYVEISDMFLSTCARSTIAKQSVQSRSRCSGVFNVNVGHISHLGLVFLLLTLIRWLQTGLLALIL